MKLKSAKIKNFKLLRDVRLEFSDDAKKPLTVIRAENESGKTSTLMALRWALYGQRGLAIDEGGKAEPDIESARDFEQRLNSVYRDILYCFADRGAGAELIGETV